MPAEDPRIDIIWYSQWRWGLHHTSAGEAYIGIVVGAFLGWLAGIGLYRVFNQGLYRFLWPQAHRTIEHVAWRIPLVATIAAMVALAGWYGSIMLYYSRFPPGIWPEAPIWIDERGIASAGRSGLPSWVDPQNPAFKHLWNFESLWQDASRRASPKIVFSGIIIAGLIGWMVGAVAFQCIRWIGWSRRPAT